MAQHRQFQASVYFRSLSWRGDERSAERLLGALICLAALFLPGILLLIGMLPFWDNFRRLAAAKDLMRGANAAVVGLLGAALYTPLWTSTINHTSDFGLAMTGFILLTVWKIPPWMIVIISVSGGVLMSLV